MTASELIRLLPDCCTEVLETMYFVTISEVVQNEAWDGACCAAFAYRLTFSGEIHGHFGIALSECTARSLAANFLGEDETGISLAEVGEVVGELSNMICGSVMSKVRTERKFVLSHPEPIPEETNFRESASCTATLQTDAGPVFTWVALDGPQ